MITVIADDITGAAEIAGIGVRFGLKASLTTDTGRALRAANQCDLLVYATDTRSMTEEEAIAETLRIGRRLKEAGCHTVFKKTDSVLRGHVTAELRALMNSLDYRRVLLIPQNPSRQRIIRDGIYYVDDLPLHHTAFAYDPEFPATTAQVTELLKGEAALLSAGEKAGYAGIYIANASATGEIASYMPLIDGQTIPAGGADCFTAFLSASGHSIAQSAVRPLGGLNERDVLIICGSTAGHPLSELTHSLRQKIPARHMPQDVFEGAPPDAWIASLQKTYRQHGSLILSVGHPPVKGRETAARLKNVMTKACIALLSSGRLPSELIIEGGATAYSILSALGWKDFRISNEISPGIIRMETENYAGCFVTLKPGSYLWHKLF